MRTLFRQAIEDTSIAGHYIPRGTEIAPSVHTSMRIDTWWQQPDVFNPES
ncbi:cytochrome P450 [Rhodococcus erythropolis]|nr:MULTISPECIES: cytochrome P450 [Rhodococcus]MDJ0404225.1 cytochrome P450 [Rhodococcus erythropolis]RAL34956.1 hypothetical protein CVN56_09240 [Rhodococcus sp. AQ5-07]